MTFKVSVLAAIVLFGLGLALGLASPAGIASLLSEDIAALAELSSLLAPFSVLTIILIFFKNVLALVVSFVFSPILCLVPILALTLNGWLLAFVAGLVIEEKSLGFLLAGLLPHGIIEVPAFILGEAAALSFGTAVLLGLLKKERTGLILPNLKRNLNYLAIACALLLPAAVIETYITPLLLNQ
jgi:stage II sporulation protein M